MSGIYQKSRQRALLSQLEAKGRGGSSSRRSGSRVQNQTQQETTNSTATATVPTARRGKRFGQSQPLSVAAQRGSQSQNRRHQQRQNGFGNQKLQQKGPLSFSSQSESQESENDSSESEPETTKAQITKLQNGHGRGNGRSIGKGQAQSRPSTKGNSKSMGGFINDEASSEEESEADSSSSSNNEEDGPKAKRPKVGKRKSKGVQKNPTKQSLKSVYEFPGKNGICQPKKTLVENAIMYFLLRQGKMAPFSRSDIVRDAMNGQNKVFDKIIKKVTKILLNTFLLKLVGFEKSDSKTKDQYSSYILVSLLPRAVSFDLTEKLDTEDGNNAEMIRSFLVVTLTSIFMGGNPMEEDVLWDVMQQLEFDTDLCPVRENFEKFLKTEYVSKQYLICNELSKVEKSFQETQDRISYDWGLRSLYEFSKMEMLKTTAKQLKVLDINLFPHAYQDAKSQMEKFGSLAFPDSQIVSISDAPTEDSDDDDSMTKLNVDLARSPPRPSSATAPAHNNKGIKTKNGGQNGKAKGQLDGRPSTRKWSQEQLHNSTLETQPMELDSSETD